MAVYLRGKTWWLKVSVPVESQAAYGADSIRESLRTRDPVEAAMLAKRRAAELRKDFARAVKDKEALAYEKARRRAEQLGFTYRRTAELVDRMSDLVRRLEAIPHISSRADVDALLGGVEPPPLKLSTILATLYEQTQHETRNKSPDQMRKWKAQRERAFSNLIGVIGDQPLADVTRADALRFREWWRGRIEKDGLTANSANKDMMCLSGTVRAITERLMLPIQNVFTGLYFSEDVSEKQKRAPYSTEFVRDVILKPGALDGLNPEARAVLLTLINTGARPSEICNLTPEHIHLEAAIPYISIAADGREVKSARALRDIPLTGVSLEAMKNYPEGFPRYRDKDSFSALANKYLRNNGMIERPGCVVYSLRHRFQDMLTAQNASQRLDRDLMGHALDRESYGEGASLEQKLEVIKRFAL